MSVQSSATSVPQVYDGTWPYDSGTYDGGATQSADTLSASPAVGVNYTDRSFPTYLIKALDGTSSVMWVANLSGYPPTPFNVSVDVGTSIQEVMTVTSISASGAALLTRDVDGKGAFPHAVNATVQHTSIALDFKVMNHHIYDNTVDWHQQYLDDWRHTSPALHLCGTAIGYGAPSMSNPSDAISIGISGAVALSDHVHGRETLGAILQNAVPPGMGMFVSLVRTSTFFWLQQTTDSATSANPLPQYTNTGIALPSSDVAPLSTSSASIDGHVWDYAPVIVAPIEFWSR